MLYAKYSSGFSFYVVQSIQSSVVVQQPSALGYASSRITSITRARRMLMFCIALSIGLQYDFLAYEPIANIVATLFSMVLGRFFFVIVWYYALSITITLIERRLPSFISPYVLPVVFCCAILNLAWHFFRQTI